MCSHMSCIFWWVPCTHTYVQTHTPSQYVCLSVCHSYPNVHQMPCFMPMHICQAYKIPRRSICHACILWHALYIYICPNIYHVYPCVCNLVIRMPNSKHTPYIPKHITKHVYADAYKLRHVPYICPSTCHTQSSMCNRHILSHILNVNPKNMSAEHAVHAFMFHINLLFTYK